MMESYLAWVTIQNDWTTLNEQYPITEGVTVQHSGKTKQYSTGASIDPIRAIQSQAGAILCRVEVLNHIEQEDMIYETHQYLKCYPAREVLWRFFIQVAQQALNWTATYSPRSYLALETRQLWIANRVPNNLMQGMIQEARQAMHSANRVTNQGGLTESGKRTASATAYACETAYYAVQNFPEYHARDVLFNAECAYDQTFYPRNEQGGRAKYDAELSQQIENRVKRMFSEQLQTMIDDYLGGE